MPLRLIELVKKYPYGPPETEDGLLPRPRFSTRRFDAVFIRVETTAQSTKSKLHPVSLVKEALRANIEASLGENGQLWEKVKHLRRMIYIFEGGRSYPLTYVWMN